MELKAAEDDEEPREEPQTKGPDTAGIVAEWKEEEGGEEEEEEDEEEGWRLVSKGIEECESRAETVRSMGGEEGGRGPKVTRGLRVTEVVIGRRDGTAREEPGPRGVAEEGCDGRGNGLMIMLFWRN